MALTHIGVGGTRIGFTSHAARREKLMLVMQADMCACDNSLDTRCEAVYAHKQSNIPFFMFRALDELWSPKVSATGEMMPSKTTRQSPLKTDQKQISGSELGGGALYRGLTILKVLERAGQPLSNQAIAEETGLPRPTVSRLTSILMTQGFLVSEPDFQRFRLGPAVLSLAHSFLATDSLTGVLAPELQELAVRTKGTVGYAVRDMLDLVYRGMWYGVNHITLRQEAGSRVQLIGSVTGLAILAGEEKSQRELLLNQITRDFTRQRRLEVFSNATRASDEIERSGFYVAVGLFHPDINGIAIPFKVGADTRVYAASLGGPSFWLTEKVLREERGPALLQIMERFEQQGVVRLCK
jgi:DNA-binding IclR family transcriptional regulator